MADVNMKDKMSKGIQSEIDRQNKNQGKKTIGEYNEAPGGGTPAKGGGRGAMKGDFEVVNSKEEADKIREQDPNAKIRYNQPRAEDGTFAHNSANGKPLSTKYSRGKHEPVFLNGVDLTFIKKGSTFQYKNEQGNLERIISSIDMTKDDLISACSVYFKHEGGFLGVIGTAVTKKGAQSKVEKTGVTGKTGDKDVSKMSANTQNDLAAAALNKDQASLDEQTKIRKGPQPPSGGAVAKPNTPPSSSAVNPQQATAGAGANANSNQTQQPVTSGTSASQTPTSQTTQNPGGNNVNLSSLQNVAQDMLKQYLASKNNGNNGGNAQNVNKGISQQGKTNLMNKWLKKNPQQ